MDTFTTLAVGMVSRVNACSTSRIIRCTYVQFPVHQVHLNKGVKKETTWIFTRPNAATFEVVTD